MARSQINVTLDRDFLVILLYRASVNHRTVNEEVEELLYSSVRADAESDPSDEQLAHLDDLYGQIHAYWESIKPQDIDPGRMPY